MIIAIVEVQVLLAAPKKEDPVKGSFFFGRVGECRCEYLIFWYNTSMNLHRTDVHPDWHAVSPARRNVWQRIAAARPGILTPGNVITLIGLTLVIVGLGALLHQHYWVAGWLVLAGRLCDLLDGWAADATGTKSPLGEIVDATVDKLETGAAFVVLLLSQLLSWWIVGLLLVVQVIIAIISLVARRQKIALHPSRRGKVAMALVWVLIVGLVVLRVAGIHIPTLEVLASFVVLFETLLVAREYREQLRAK